MNASEVAALIVRSPENRRTDFGRYGLVIVGPSAPRAAAALASRGDTYRIHGHVVRLCDRDEVPGNIRPGFAAAALVESDEQRAPVALAIRVRK